MEYKEIYQLLTKLGFSERKYSGHGNRIFWSKFIHTGDLILSWYSGRPDEWDLEYRELYSDNVWTEDWIMLCPNVNLKVIEQFVIAFENLKQ